MRSRIDKSRFPEYQFLHEYVFKSPAPIYLLFLTLPLSCASSYGRGPDGASTDRHSFGEEDAALASLETAVPGWPDLLLCHVLLQRCPRHPQCH